MKILLHSNAPTVKTGYGVQCALLADRLAADGHDVAVSATYGLPAGCGLSEWLSPSGHRIPIYPSWFLVSGDDVVLDHARQHFAGEEGWIIPLIDVWSMQNPALKEHNVIAWAPVDHDPVPPGVLGFFQKSGARCIAMSRHGEAQFAAAGLDPQYAPLAVDCNVYKPTFTINVRGRDVTGRQILGVPNEAFLVGMVGMNKDPNDRKGWQEAFAGFARFAKNHPAAMLHVHTEPRGRAGGVDLVELADATGIPNDRLVFTNQYDYLIGLTPEMMAVYYTAYDVLLAPSVGEGFCVPLIEAQACGVPVIASTFTAQRELVGAGWQVSGQLWWDQASHSWYQRADIAQVADALEAAFSADLAGMQDKAREFALQYDADRVYDLYWRPILASLDLRPPATKPPMVRVAVLVPAVNRPANVARLVESFDATNDGTATLYYVCDDGDDEQIRTVLEHGATVLPAVRGTSFASKINAGFDATSEDFVLVCGDDVEFAPGWLAAARALSDRYDVIGTNDSEPGRIRNPKVAKGTHADHFFVRRSYVMDEGASLEGPGVLAPEAYFHFWTDVEIIMLARARGVFAPCLDSRVIHHHPGYDGREDLRAADPTYMKAVEFSQMDEIAFKRRCGLIEQHRVVKKDIWS